MKLLKFVESYTDYIYSIAMGGGPQLAALKLIDMCENSGNLMSLDNKAFVERNRLKYIEASNILSLPENVTSIIALCLLAAFWLASCAAETQWSKSGTNAAQMFRDLAQCRDLASIQAEKELRLDQESLRPETSGSGEDYRARMMIFSARKRRIQLTERCMRQSGYQKVK